MTKPVTARNNTLEQWRTHTNRISDNLGDPANVYVSDNANNTGGVLGEISATNTGFTYTHPGSESNATVLAINDLNDRKVRRSGDTIAGSLAIREHFQVMKNSTLGTVGGDTLTINSTSITCPNSLNFDSNTLYIDASNNRVAVGNATPGDTLDVTGTFAVSGTAKLNGGTTTSTQTTYNHLNTTVTTVNEYGVATVVNIGSTTVDAQTVNMFTSSTGASAYNFATGNNGGNVKTVNIGTGGAGVGATNISIGSSVAGTTTLNSPIVVGTVATQALWNTGATTVNAFGQGTTVVLGAATGTFTVNNATINLNSAGASRAVKVLADDTTTSAVTGALQVIGGVGIGKALWVEQTLRVVGNSVFSADVTASGASAAIVMSPTGTGSVTISPAGAITLTSGAVGAINNMTIGATTRGTAAFTTLAANSAVTFTAGTTSTTTGTGTLVVTGGVGVSENANIGGYVTVPTIYSQAATAGVLTVRANRTDTTTGYVAFTDSLEASSSITGAARFAGGVGVAKKLYVGTDAAVGAALTAAGAVTFTAGTTSTTTGTGTLVVTGGIGVSENINAGGYVTVPVVYSQSATGGNLTVRANRTDTTTGYVAFTDSLDATTALNGAARFAGGVGVAKKLYVGTDAAVGAALTAAGSVTFTANTSSTTTGTGTLVVTGGVGVSENINAGGYITVPTIYSQAATAGTLTIRANRTDTTTGYVAFADSLDATTSTDGAARFAGGVGVAKKLYVGTSLTVTSNLTVGGTIAFNGTGTTTVSHTGAVLFSNIGTWAVSGTGNATINPSGSVSITPTTTVTINPTTSTTIGSSGPLYVTTTTDNTLGVVGSGSAQFSGGVGVAMKLSVGTSIWTPVIGINTTTLGSYKASINGDVKAIGSVVVTGASSVIKMSDVDDSNINTETGTTKVSTASTATVALMTFASASYGSAEVTVQAATASNRQLTKFLVTTNGTVAMINEYGTVITGSTIGTFSSDITAGTVTVNVTPASASATVFKVHYTRFTT